MKRRQSLTQGSLEYLPCAAEPRNIRETDQPFPEPALFLLNPDGEVVVIDYSNSPFARPDLRILVEGGSLLTCLFAHYGMPAGPLLALLRY